MPGFRRMPAVMMTSPLRPCLVSLVAEHLGVEALNGRGFEEIRAPLVPLGHALDDHQPPRAPSLALTARAPGPDRSVRESAGRQLR